MSNFEHSFKSQLLLLLINYYETLVNVNIVLKYFNKTNLAQAFDLPCRVYGFEWNIFDITDEGEN